MPGLFFIALNRILAPAFYAQSDSKSPTIAGIISFVVNIVCAVVLVQSFRGAGIALALSIASTVNTFLLLLFLKKNPNIAVGSALRSALGYMLKLTILSAIAVIPLRLLSPYLLDLFAGKGRIISYGIPLIINTIVYTTLGIILLLATQDKQLKRFIKIVKRKKTGNK
jgi:putative peptidoglycan lipid II flippase